MRFGQLEVGSGGTALIFFFWPSTRPYEGVIPGADVEEYEARRGATFWGGCSSGCCGGVGVSTEIPVPSIHRVSLGVDNRLGRE